MQETYGCTAHPSWDAPASGQLNRMSTWLKLRWRPPEDPIAGTDQKSENYQLKMWMEFVGRDPPPIACDSFSTDLADVSKNYRKRSIAVVFKQSKLISKELQRFQVAVMFIDPCKPTGNCTDNKLLSVAIARNKDIMKGSGLD
jgi:hypothetical protein